MKRPFSGWREGAPFYLPALVIGSVFSIWAGVAGIPFLPILVHGPFLFILYFFRDPSRAVPPDSSAIVSPADGKVTAVEDLALTPWYDGPCKRVSIFLSVFDVHVNRAPDDATIARIERKAGVFKNAMDPESSELNEAVTLWLETPHGAMTVRQIAGLIARRIVCPVKPGDCLTRGQRFGMIRFGSRTDLYLRADARVVVRPGDRVRGANTVVARFD